MKKGNVLIIAVIFIAICMMIILFISVIFMSHVNSLLYNLKLEMYSINKAAIIAVNKVRTSIDDFSYNARDYKNHFQDLLRKSYDLNNEFENKDKMIESIKILEYEIYEIGEKDSYTGVNVDDRVIHTVLEIKVKPIIMKKVFEKIFVFKLHEDVNLNLLKVEE